MMARTHKFFIVRAAMRIIHRIEDSISGAALLIMAVLPLVDMVLRPFSSWHIPGSTIWTQHLTLWVGLLGASIAARRGELLSLGTGQAFFKGRWKTVAEVCSAGVGVAVCGVLLAGSLDLVAAEMRGGRELALGVPVWVAQTVLPFGFGVIGLRLCWHVAESIRARLATAAFLLVPLALMWVSDPSESPWIIPLVIGVLIGFGLGTPIFAALGGLAAVLLWSNLDPMSAIPLEAYNLSVKPMLPTLPLFTLAGFILAEGGTPKRLVELTRALFGWVPGGVALVAILVCAFFTSFTGGSGVTILAMGGLLFPMMIQDGHAKRFTTGLLTSSGSLGLLFPPSLAVILYALVAEVEVKGLFLGGLVPGLLQVVLVGVYVYWFSARMGIRRVGFQPREVGRALWRAKWEVTIPIVVLWSILGGFATLVEASAITAAYAFLVVFVIHRDLSIRRDLLRVTVRAATLIGAVLVILGVALGLTNYLVFAQIPDLAVDWVESFVSSPLMFLLLLNVFLLLVGCVMDIFSAIVVVVPLITPLGLHFGINPYHLGIIFLTNLELGYLTPPVGMNLFLASHRFEQPLGTVYRAALPFLAIRIVVVALVTYVPVLTLYLPSLIQTN